MIKKSRLEELIKEGATIYCADRDVQFPIPIFLNEEDFVKKEDLPHEENCIRDNILLEDLYETEEQAEWALKYQHIPKTEWLDLPMWEEMYESANRNVFYHRKGIIGKIDGIRYPNVDERVITIRSIYARNEKDVLFNAPATEENYIKACDLCVKLFKGDIGE